jgi:hypothetical protein
MNLMLRPALALALVALVAGCAKEAPKPAPQAAYVPPPLPVPPPAQWCVKPTEMSAFHLAALKSNLMVTAISCKAEDKYNAFIMKNRPTLVAGEKAVDSYFSRNDRRRASQIRDDYITQLANAQSQRALVLGNQFCERNIGQFDEVMSVSAPDQLPTLAASKTDVIPQALKFEECPAQPPAPAKPARAPAKRK